MSRGSTRDNTRKETHGTAIPFLVAMARARTSCAPGATVLRLDGRRLTVAADGRFRARDAHPRTLLATNANGDATGVRFGPPSRTFQPRLSRADRRVRAQIAARVSRLARAVRPRERPRDRSRLGLGYRSGGGDSRSDVVRAWASVFRESSIERVRFQLEAFDPGDRLCGGPVVASVPWTVSGRLPLSVPFTEGGGGRSVDGGTGRSICLPTEGPALSLIGGSSGGRQLRPIGSRARALLRPADLRNPRAPNHLERARERVAEAALNDRPDDG